MLEKSGFFAKLEVLKWRHNRSQSPVFSLVVLYPTGSEIWRFWSTAVKWVRMLKPRARGKARMGMDCTICIGNQMISSAIWNK